ncbi:hypothetical protein [Qipengyuania sp. MTN3-11]|uniref:hypothetical protein n=1 Tax=Qipengyuania sp. MTN3-11 TaxID=3056557 RepID=UPI0036F23A7D
MKAPSPPDPVQTAVAQGGVNRDTAVSQQLLNMVSQQNPWGSVAYNQSGTTSYVDSLTGKTVTVPQFTQTTTLSPEQQAIFDKSQAAQTNLAGIAEAQSGRVADALSDPFQFTNQDAADWSYDLAQTRIAPQQQRNEAALRSRLVNSGIRPGTAAWNSEMERLTQANTDQNNMLALQGRSQAFSENLATRNQPLNELSALLSGSQVSNPAQMSSAAPQVGVGGVDYAGMVQDNYQAKLQRQNALMGGLFGLAGTGIRAATGGFG